MDEAIMDAVIRRIEVTLNAFDQSRDIVKKSAAASEQWSRHRANLIGLRSRCQMNDPSLKISDLADFWPSSLNSALQHQEKR